MRSITRLPLDEAAQAGLAQRQAAADHKRLAGTLHVSDEWQSARQTHLLRTVVLGTLRRMMGERERCMYCLDSHGTDIEHFWPKKPYPERMFQWPNMLLCCTECGRLKGNRFPLLDGQPLIIDPTAEEPWEHLDFDPTTGNIIPRFDLNTDDWSARGQTTVGVLQLDRREAMAAGYRRTFLRLAALAERHLHSGATSADALISALNDADKHGLLGWCFIGTGQHVPPFQELKQQQPEVWTACLAAISQRSGATP
jgi:uncharacterized protein (TIGR02646 family)